MTTSTALPVRLIFRRPAGVFFLCAAAVTLLFCLPLLRVRITSPFWWPTLLGVPAWWWFFRRHIRAEIAWNRTAILFVLLWLATLLTGIVRGSGWWAMTAMWLLACGLGSVFECGRGRGRNISLVASLPWLLLAGAPPMFSNRVWPWLTEWIGEQLLVSAVAAGRVAWREGTTLISVDHRCDIQDLTGSPLGLTAWLLAAWVVIMCGRPSLIKAVVSLVFVVFYAVLASTAMIWLSVFSGAAGILGAGIGAVTVGHIMLAVIAAPALYLVKTFTSAFSGSIRKKLDNGCAPELLVELWNRHCSCSGFTDDSDWAPVCPVWKRIRLAEVPQFLIDWVYSRPLAMYFSATPAVLLAALLLCWSSAVNNLQPVIAATATKALQAARETSQPLREEQLLRTLIAIEPRNPEHSLQLALLFLRENRRDECLQMMSKLTAEDEPGYSAARVWLVRNSLGSNPLVLLTKAQQISQLQRAVELDAGNIDAHQMLARLYLELGELLLAETQFRAAANLDPVWSLELLRIYRQRQQLPSDLNDLENYRRQLAQRLRADPDSTANRLNLAEFDFLAGNVLQAIELLNSRPLSSETAELRRQEVRLRSEIVLKLTFEGESVHGATLIPELKAALKLAPDDGNILSAAVHLYVLRGLRPDDDTLTVLADYWKNITASDSDTRHKQAQIALLTGNLPSVVETLASENELNFVDALALTHSLMTLNQQPAAEQVVREAMVRLGAWDSPEKCGQAIQLLAVAGMFSAARESCAGIAAEPMRNSFRNLIDLLEFDALVGYPGQLAPHDIRWIVPLDVDSDRAAALLKGPLVDHELHLHVLNRMFMLRSAAPHLHGFVDGTIRTIVARSGNPETLLGTLGTNAAVVGQWQYATECFDRALQSNRSRDAAVLNNLAIAIVRSGRTERFHEALRLIEEARKTLPENIELLATRGEVLMAMQRWPAAESDLQRVLSARPKHPDAIRLLPLLKERQAQ